ncbi:MAG: SRPBCC family protein [Kofleriaceae bacterium]
MSETDRIEKQITLRAPRARVWRALTRAEEFGSWFGVKLESEFALGQPIKGKITHPGFTHLTFEAVVEKLEPEHTFAMRWHPAAVDPAVDYAPEPTTLVELTLEEVAGGTQLTIVESGFDRLPAARRAEAFRMNGDGWTAQLDNIRRHVET